MLLSETWLIKCRLKYFFLPTRQPVLRAEALHRLLHAASRGPAGPAAVWRVAAAAEVPRSGFDVSGCLQDLPNLRTPYF